MASTSQSHATFPSRPYASTFAASKTQDHPAPTGRGISSHTIARENAARQERERQERERQERERAAQQQAQAGTLANGAMAQLTDEQRDEINEAFGLFDLDKDGQIDYHEFKVSLKALGFDLSKPDLLSYLKSYGVPPTSTQGSPQEQGPTPDSRLRITLPGFQTIASTLIAERDPKDEILRAFSLFDTGGKGMITFDDLKRVARELGEGLEDDEIAAMIEEFDLENKGGVSTDEFLGICMG